MIVVPAESSFLLVTQPDHAHLAGEILSLWRAGGLPDNPRRDDLLFAAREHDNGWPAAAPAPPAGTRRAGARRTPPRAGTPGGGGPTTSSPCRPASGSRSGSAGSAGSRPR